MTDIIIYGLSFRHQELSVVERSASLGDFHNRRCGPWVSPSHGLPLSCGGVLCTSPPTTDGSEHHITERLTRVRWRHGVFKGNVGVFTEHFTKFEVGGVSSAKVVAISGSVVTVSRATIGPNKLEGHRPSTTVDKVLSSVSPFFPLDGSVVPARVHVAVHLCWGIGVVHEHPVSLVRCGFESSTNGTATSSSGKGAGPVSAEVSSVVHAESVGLCALVFVLGVERSHGSLGASLTGECVAGDLCSWLANTIGC